MRAPVNSFEFQPCGRTPQAGHLMVSLRHRTLTSPTPNAHRLGRGLPGYLILFATHAFAPQRQYSARGPPSPQAFLLISTHSPLHQEFRPPLTDSSKTVSKAVLGLSPKIPPQTCSPPTRPLSPVIPNNARHLCLTAAAGTELAVAYSLGTGIIFPKKRSLQPEDLHPPRGVAASGFPPLCNIPHCCLP